MDEVLSSFPLPHPSPARGRGDEALGVFRRVCVVHSRCAVPITIAGAVHMIRRKAGGGCQGCLMSVHGTSESIDDLGHTLCLRQ